MNLSNPEPQPKPNDSTPIWELVIADMRERDHAGRAKYGVPLQAGNGRDPLVDAYQEALDLAVYLRQAIAERDARASGRASQGNIEIADLPPPKDIDVGDRLVISGGVALVTGIDRGTGIVTFKGV